MSTTAEEELAPIVKGWLGKITLAKEAKKEFNDVAEQCMAFFDSASRKFWEAKFQRKCFGKTIHSPFKFSMGKAFELVAIFGPTLYHKNPHRAVRPYEPLQFGPELFGIPSQPPQPPPPEAQQDPMAMYQYQTAAQQYQAAMGQYQQRMQQEGLDASRNTKRCELMERYLSFTPREQPDGGLEEAARRGITEALVKGRGLLWAETYANPGSSTKLTGCFYGSVDELLIDPDAISHHFGEARWIARRHRHPAWMVEKKFGLKHGALKGKGTIESSDARGANSAKVNTETARNEGKTFDLMEYWEIWSIGGVGTRLTGVTYSLSQSFDEVVGDYAYIVVAGGVSYPLNAPPASALDDPAQSFESVGDDEVAAMFAWPVPYWKDRRWPVVMLDFYVIPHNEQKPRRSAWPQPPLGPAIAELSALNIIISGLVNAVHEGSRTYAAMAKSMAEDFGKMFDEDGPFGKISIPDSMMQGATGGIESLIHFFRAPDQSKDILMVIQMLLNLVEKRTGLSEILYSRNSGGAASRSATDAASKSEKASVRPEDMANRVAKWLSEGAEIEKICAYWSGPKGRDLVPFFGRTGAELWDQLIANEEPEVVFYGMRCTVEASDVRKPNKERDAQNMGQLYPPLSQTFMGAQQMGPLNALHKLMFKAIDQPWSDSLLMQPPPQPPGPSPQEIEQQKLQGEMALKQADMQAKQADVQLKAQSAQVKMQQDQQANEMKMQQEARTVQWDAMKAMLGLQQQRAEGAVKLQSAQQLGNEKLRLAKIDAKIKSKVKANAT